MRLALRRGVVAAGCLVLASVCVASALDRAGVDRPDWLRPVVPFAIGSAEARNAAIESLRERQFGKALAAARDVVRRSPLTTPSTSLLGGVQLAMGQDDAADASFRTAALLGWRDPATQSYWLESATAQQAYEVAAERLDALLRVGASSVEMLAAEQQIEQDPVGRAMIARRLAARPDWRLSFVRRLSDLASDGRRGRLAVLANARALGLKMDDDVLGETSFALVQGGAVDDAFALWHIFRGPGDFGSAGVWDGALTTLPRHIAVNPFVWSAVGDSQAVIEEDRRRFPRAVHVSAGAASRDDIARTLTRLRPGTYTLSWRAVDENGRAVPGLRFRVDCLGGGAPPGHEVERGDGGMFRTVVDVPASGCAVQRVTVYADGEFGADRVEGWIGDPRITPS